MRVNDENKNIWREKFESFEAEPVRDLWTGIEKQIPGERRKFPFLMIAGIAASLLLLAAFSFLVLLPPKDSTEGKMADNIITEPIIPQKPAPPTATQLAEAQTVSESATESAAPTPRKERVSIPKANPRQALMVIQPEMASIMETDQPEENKTEKKELATIEPPVQISPDVSGGISPEEVMATAAQIPEIETIPLAENEVVPVSDTRGLIRFEPKEMLKMASDGLNRIANTPLDVYHKKEKNEEVWTYEFTIANFKFTKKSRKKTLTQDEL